jgi:hypothetical protein
MQLVELAVAQHLPQAATTSACFVKTTGEGAWEQQ